MKSLIADDDLRSTSSIGRFTNHEMTIWIMLVSGSIILLYALFFLLTWRQVGPRDFDQFLVFHELQYWNAQLFGMAKQWSPVMCSGLPLAGEPQVPVLSLTMLLGYLLGPMNGLKAGCVVYLVAGWCGAYAYAGLWQRGAQFRALAASLFIGNGFFVYRLSVGHVDFVPFLLLPSLLWMLHQCIPTARRPFNLRMALITLAGAALISMAIDGAPVAIIHLLLWMSLYAVVLAVVERSPAPLLFMLAVGLMTTVLDAAYLWPMLEAQREFPRQTADRFTSPLGFLLHAILPIRGKLTTGSGKGHELTVFIGPVLAWLMWRYRRHWWSELPTMLKWPLLYVSVVGLWLGMGSLLPLHVPLWLSPFDLLRSLPGFRSLGVTARFWGFLALPLSLIAAHCLHRYLLEDAPIHRRRWCAAAALIIQCGFAIQSFHTDWHGTRRHTEVSFRNAFAQHGERIDYVDVEDDTGMQGAFITPTRGVRNCYDMDDFLRARIDTGSQLVREPVGTPVAAEFIDWNTIHLQSTTPVTETVVLNHAWHRHWHSDACKLQRSGDNNLIAHCPASALQRGVKLTFDDAISRQGLEVSRKAWLGWVVLLALLAIPWQRLFGVSATDPAFKNRTGNWK